MDLLKRCLCFARRNPESLSFSEDDCYLTLNLYSFTNNGWSLQLQRAKKVMSDSPGLVDFAIGLVIFALNLPNGQVLSFGEIQITEGL